MALNKMEAELHSLQLQIHPHFLCNLLESIRSLNELGNHFEANAMIQELGDFFPLFHLARNANCTFKRGNCFYKGILQYSAA